MFRFKLIFAIKIVIFVIYSDSLFSLSVLIQPKLGKTSRNVG